MNRKNRRAAARQARKQARKLDRDVWMADVCWNFIKALGVGDVRLFLSEAAALDKNGEWSQRRADALQSIGPVLDSRYGLDAGTTERAVTVLLGLGHYSAVSASNIATLASWYDQGLPTLELGHKLAASLMVTSIGPQVLEGLRMPFHSFCLRVPTGLVFMHDMKGEREVEVTELRMGWMQDSAETPMYVFYGKCSDDSTQMFGHYESLEMMYEDVSDAPLSDSHFLDVVLDDLDKRSSLLCRRLLLNVCLMMTEGKHKELTRRPSHSGQSTRQGPPTRRVFRLTQAVTHNFRDNVSKFLRSGGGKINVQCIVSGHWKMQPCGPGLLERKRIFVEPYWRGPEDAEIAVRPHKL